MGGIGGNWGELGGGWGCSTTSLPGPFAYDNVELRFVGFFSLKFIKTLEC